MAKDIYILDAGCGTGLVGAHLHGRGFTTITGMDIFAKCLQEAEKEFIGVLSNIIFSRPSLSRMLRSGLSLYRSPFAF